MSRKNRIDYSHKYNENVIEDQTIIEDNDFIEEDELINDQTVEETKKCKVVIPQDKKLNVREEPSINSLVLTELSNDTEIKIIDDTYNDWFKIVTTYGIEGYILKDYVELV